MSQSSEIYSNNSILNALNINKKMNSYVFSNENDKDKDINYNIDNQEIITNVSVYNNNNNSVENNKSVELYILKENIEKMSKFHQIEILSIIIKYNNINITENNNGTFINLSELPNDVIENLKMYVKYVDEQQKNLFNIENEKMRLEKIFIKDNKDKISPSIMEIQ